VGKNLVRDRHWDLMAVERMPAVPRRAQVRARPALRHPRVRLCVSVLVLAVLALPAFAREKDPAQYGAGLIVNVPFPEATVLPVVQEVAQSGIIRGTKEYSKDEYVTGASFADSTRAFPEWTEGGKVFYKVKLKALDPLNFKDTNDVGTLAVRYVVQGQDQEHTVIHIDARFVEDFRRMAHASNGSVEGAEYKSIHDRLDAIEAMKNSTAEAEKEKQEALARKPNILVDETAPSTPTTVAATATTPVPEARSATIAPEADASAIPSPPMPPQTLEQRVQDLRRQVERTVKAPGAPLKGAPFHSAATLESLPAATQVLIEIETPYWLGVETHEGQHGWILRDNLELVK
jgi:hypothetical protein